MKKAIHRPFVGLLCAFILLFGINLAIPRANASNAYISNINFHIGADNLAVLDFFVNTSFNITIGAETPLDAEVNYCLVGNAPSAKITGGTYIAYGTAFWPIDPNYIPTCGTIWNFTAGNTYSVLLSANNAMRINKITKKICILGNCPIAGDQDVVSFSRKENFTEAHYIHDLGYASYSDWWILQDLEHYFFTEAPTLDITFPLPNAEISQAFNITGSYTMPSGYNKLVAYIGVGIPYAQYSFLQNLTDPSGDIDIRVSGVPSGNYQMFFYFSGDSVESYYVESATRNFSILTAIPPELPETGETPPEFYDPIDGDIYYLDFSSYDTPTALYSNLKNAIQPIFTIIGSNLTFFSSQFDQDTAKETGEKTGQGILIIRTYSSNLNTFFNDLPVSEFLLFYLLLLIVVIVFRIIKNLINVIKP